MNGKSKKPRQVSSKPRKSAKKITFKNIVKKVNMLTKEVQGEKKYLQQGSNSPCGVQSGAGVQGLLLDGPLALSSPGTAVANRIGNRVKLLNMQIKGIVAQQANTTANRKIRIMLVENLDHNLLSPVITAAGLVGNLYDNDARTGTITTESYRTFVCQKNWKIWGQTTVFLPQDSISGQTTERTFNMYIKFGKYGLMQNYNALASQLERGALYLIGLVDNGDIAVGVQTGVRIYYDIRTMFVDN